MSLLALQEKFQTASRDFQKLQADLSNAVEARQRLDAQLSENEMVKKEFALLKPENEVYKQIGPVLVKQEQAEAKSNVDTRLEFIRGEIKRMEAQLKDIETKSEKKKQEVRLILPPESFSSKYTLISGPPISACRDTNDYPATANAKPIAAILLLNSLKTILQRDCKRRSRDPNGR
ncbi:Prefoldin subunit 6 [Marasmius crinis-equi]|uniref:Prefoldin subunit 6 n=1 Tax=Marasmius crinis-equi TaxID=585013 RepID=A0ABR3ER99_9AGAR